MDSAETIDRTQRIISCVKEVLGGMGIAYDGAPDLLKSGMNSMATLQLILGLEAEFDISIPDEMLDLSNFATLDAISNTIDAAAT